MRHTLCGDECICRLMSCCFFYLQKVLAKQDLQMTLLKQAVEVRAFLQNQLHALYSVKKHLQV